MLTAIVCAAMGLFGVFKYLSMSATKRSDKSTSLFLRYLMGIGMVWLGIEFKEDLGQLSTAIAWIAGLYLIIFNGAWLFEEVQKK